MARHIWKRLGLGNELQHNTLLKKKYSHKNSAQLCLKTFNFDLQLRQYLVPNKWTGTSSEKKQQHRPNCSNVKTPSRDWFKFDQFLNVSKVTLFSSIDLSKNSFSSPFVHLTSGKLDRKLSYPLLCSRYCLCACPGATFSKVLVSFGPVWKSFFYLLRQDRDINRFEIQMWSWLFGNETYGLRLRVC